MYEYIDCKNCSVLSQMYNIIVELSIKRNLPCAPITDLFKLDEHVGSFILLQDTSKYPLAFKYSDNPPRPLTEIEIS